EFVPADTAAPVPAEPRATTEALRPEADSKPVARPPPAPRRRPSAAWRLAAIAVVVVALTGILALLNRAVIPQADRPGSPMAVAMPQLAQVVVAEFSSLTGDASFNAPGARLSGRIAELLGPFDSLAILPADGNAVPPAGAYVVGGVINPDPGGFRISATLNRDGERLWTEDVSLSGRDATQFETAAHDIAVRIAAFTGPLHERGRQWLDAQRRPLPGVDPYVCLLTYQLAREEGRPAQIADALVCQERL